MEFDYEVKPFNIPYEKIRNFPTMQEALDYMESVASSHDCTIPSSSQNVPNDFNKKGDIFFTFNLSRKPGKNKAEPRQTDSFFIVTCKKQEVYYANEHKQI